MNFVFNKDNIQLNFSDFSIQDKAVNSILYLTKTRLLKKNCSPVSRLVTSRRGIKFVLTILYLLNTRLVSILCLEKTRSIFQIKFSLDMFGKITLKKALFRKNGPSRREVS